ncbi:aquaporin-9-like [Haliotis rufescens]|uniref:aquaporin-9-like n=1 Tax=Haliotis rufescens TaxID=6454 RepID=UPI00201EF08F|nr:aquaporin-9-like [Haliotis rufescens]
MMTLKKKLQIKNELARQIIAEFWGTFILVTFAIASGAQYVLSRQELSSYLSVSFAGGMGLTLGIYWSGGVSGGCLNPAVTMALCLRGVIPWYKWPFYTMANLGGSFLAAAVQYLLYFDALNNYDGGLRSTTGPTATAGIFATYPQPYVSTASCFFDQVFGTFILLGCVLAITDRRNMAPSDGFLPVALGSIMLGMGTCFALNCGYAINPARDLGPRLFTAIAGWGSDPFTFRDYNWFWVPVAGPMVGAVLAWLVYTMFIELHWPDEEKNFIDSSCPGNNGRHVVSIATVDRGHINPTFSCDTPETSHTHL